TTTLSICAHSRSFADTLISWSRILSDVQPPWTGRYNAITRFRRSRHRTSIKHHAMRIKPLLALVFAICLCGAASAADYPPAIQNLTDNGVTIVKQFDAGAGLTGYVIQANSQYGIVYGMNDGQRVLIGRIL